MYSVFNALNTYFYSAQLPAYFTIKQCFHIIIASYKISVILHNCSLNFLINDYASVFWVKHFLVLLKTEILVRVYGMQEIFSEYVIFLRFLSFIFFSGQVSTLALSLTYVHF